jgi:hypothetical protein
VAGVKKIVNRIEVQLPEKIAPPTDAAIRARIRAALLIAAVYLPGLSAVLKTQDPGLRGWPLVLGMSLIPFVLGQGVRLAQTLREPG